jgi:hypothetical protein
MDAELIVRLSRLVKGPFLERRKEITKDFVRAGLSLYDINSEFILNDLSFRIQDTTNVRLEDEAIIYHLEKFSQDGYIVHISNMKYKMLEKVDIPKFEDLTQGVWEEFKRFLGIRYHEFDPYIDARLRNVFDSLLMRFAINIVKSQKTVIDSLPIDDFRSIVEQEAHENKITWKNKFVDIFSEYILSKSPKLLEFISNRYSGIINMGLILNEQEMPLLDLIDKVGFLLVDTSFLVALMCQTDDTHALSAAVSNLCQKRNIPLYFHEETKKEMDNLIRGSKIEMSGLVVEGNPPLIRSQFVKNFRNSRDVSWPDYFAELSNWERLVNVFWDINMMPERYEFDKSVYDFVKLWLPILDRNRYDERIAIYGNAKSLRDEQQVQHDASCLGIVAAARKDMGMGSIGPWFLTFDNLVFGLSEFYSQIDKQKFSLAIQPRTWLNYLLTYSKIEIKEEEYNSVAEAIILFSARSYESNITLNDYTRLITEKLGLKTEDTDFIMELFLNSPLKAELERELDLGHGGDADRLTQKIITDKQFVDSIINQRRMKDDFKRVAGRLREVETQYREEKAAREALERCAGHNIFIKTEIKTTVEINLQTQVNALVSQLESMMPEGFGKYGLPEPPKGETRTFKLKEWLIALKAGITASKDIMSDAKSAVDNAKTLLPYITYLISLFS